jgi:hypothetical protein
MKITKSQLQQIIQEELEATLEEDQEEDLQRIIQEEFKLILENDKPDPMTHILSKIGGQLHRAIGLKPSESDAAHAVRMARLEAERRKKTGIAGTVKCGSPEECRAATGNLAKYASQFNVKKGEKIVFQPTYPKTDKEGEPVMGTEYDQPPFQTVTWAGDRPDSQELRRAKIFGSADERARAQQTQDAQRAATELEALQTHEGTASK